MRRSVDKTILIALLGTLPFLLTQCGGGGTDAAKTSASDGAAEATVVSLNSDAMLNPAAYIPPQCYTETRDESGAFAGKSSNPCFACHNMGKEPNYTNDADLQLTYAMPAFAQKNNWSNLFIDRRPEIAGIADEKILNYVRQDNYRETDGQVVLQRVLNAPLPAGWDANGDGKWNGYIPDAYFSFDDTGFDHAPDGSYTGWRAFAYAPFLGTFWPTNGSTDDVLIRLAPAFREKIDGMFDLTTYAVNLAIVQAMIQRQNVPIAAVDERIFGVDLNKDGQLDTATQITYDWAPTEGRNMQYVGLAGEQLAQGQVHIAAGLYPEGTEFIHTVRYLDPVGGEVGIGMSARMKEVRYAVKRGWNNFAQLKSYADGEVLEDMRFPDRLRRFVGNIETGLQNGTGWTYSAFIEDKQGDLRPQSKEELYACMGCHSALGVTTDSSFAFPRKLNSDQANGWYHWTQRAKGLNGLPEPQYANGVYEYTHYLDINHAGDEFRENKEVIAKFYGTGSTLIPGQVDALHHDIGTLLLPSKERAIALDKAYYLIVQEQSFNKGRDAIIEPPVNIHKTVGEDEASGVNEIYLIPR